MNPWEGLEHWATLSTRKRMAYVITDSYLIRTLRRARAGPTIPWCH